MNSQFLQNDRIYLIRNCAVARNPIFTSLEIQLFFKKKMEYYLKPVAEIMAYSLKGHEFQILIKLKGREEFADYFYKEKMPNDSNKDIPESTYIFSQIMSNLQVSLVKRINHLYDRSGTLMAGRFKRREIMEAEEVWCLIQELNSGDGHHSYSGIWINDLMNGCAEITSDWLYGGGFEENEDVYIRVEKSDLVGNFNYPKKNTNYLPSKHPLPKIVGWNL